MDKVRCRRLLGILALSIPVLGCAVCRTPTPTPTPTPSPTPQPTATSRFEGVASIGSVATTITFGEGGSITASDGRLEIAFPAGAVSEDTIVAVTTLDWTEGLAYRLEPDGLVLDKSASVTLTVTADDVGETLDPDGNPYDLTQGMPGLVVLLESSTGELEQLDDTTISTELGSGVYTVTGELSHFSYFSQSNHHLCTFAEFVIKQEQTVRLDFRPITYYIVFLTRRENCISADVHRSTASAHGKVTVVGPETIHTSGPMELQMKTVPGSLPDYTSCKPRMKIYVFAWIQSR